MNLNQTQKIFTLYAPIFFMTNSKFKDSIFVKICARNEDIGGIKNILGDPERDYPTNCDQEKFYDFKISLI